MVNIVKFIGAILPLIALLVDCNGEFLELSQYHRMPKMAETDDYDQCMQESVPGEIAVFCMTRAVIKPDKSSDLWNLIEDFSNDRRHHNHALLERGICMNECKKFVKSLSNTTTRSLMVPKFPIDFTYIHDTTVLKDSVKDRERYGKLVEIWKILLASFSILRNWNRLTSYSEEPLNKDLRIFQAVRFWGMCIVISGHIMSAYNYLPQQNPSKMEMANHSIFMLLIFEGKQFVQSFFVMGAFLLTVMVLKLAKTHKKPLGISFVLKAILYRYIRLTPAYAFMILLHTTWMAKLQDGPWWTIRMETERVFCRRNWWINLLYLNNYNEEHCFIHGWYLSCDFQLFILAILLLLAIVRFKKYVLQILAIVGVASVLIPAFFVYHDKLDGTLLVTPQSDRFFSLFDEFLIKSYTALHMNLGNYLIGIVAAMIYLNLRKQNANLGIKKWFKIVWYLVFPVGFGTMLLNSIFYIYDFEKPSLWMAAFFPLSKYIWGVYTSLFFIGLIFGVQPATKRVLSHRIFEILGRLTYSAYLAHLFIIHLTLYNIRSPIHFGFTETITTVISNVVLSYLMGLVLCLLLELPVTALQKLIFANMKVNHTDSREKLSGPVVQ
ncbi:nose resistant to fluoxetine protein 6-like [Ochlerotatus camptorhynchus]|uniref:nose resistant to fluoxetine protein 6-like n=1 Tax=Ochlerotatus camptorhynchus TaxID=644619 RepID=UPI0031D4D683